MKTSKQAFLTLIIFITFCFNSSIAQVSSNMTLSARWDNTSLSFNDIWGYVDDQDNEYAIVGSRQQIHFIDVTTPSNPVVKYEYTPGASTIWRDFKTYKKYCYAVADQGSEGLLIFDMSPLPGGNPVLVNQIQQHFVRAHNIFIDVPNGLAYVVGSNSVSNGAIVYDLKTDPANPTVVFSSGLQGGYIHDIFVKDNIAYASHGFNGFYMHDFSNPSNPQFIDSRNTGGYNHSSWITEDENYIIYAEEVPQGRPMGVLDISDIPNNGIELETTFKSPLLAPNHTDVTPHNPFIVGDYVVISYYEDGVVIFDISNPANPTRAGWYDTNPNNTSYSGTNSCWGVYPFFPSGTIVGLDVGRGLYVLQTNLNLPTTCNDGIQNGSELGVDCGTYCKPCSNNPPVPKLKVNLKAFLEGPYNQGSMNTTLRQLDLFPATGQPYTGTPWNYAGTEGAGWAPSDYPTNAVDWVLISVRTSPNASSTVSQAAGLLLSDGSVTVDLDITGPILNSYYVVLEHRNHLVVMSPNELTVNNSEITYDFTTADSYTGSSGFGQKLISGQWMLYCGNEEQLSIGHEITGSDIVLWQQVNGSFDIYHPSDYSLDGDLNANDKLIWSFNNGIFSGVPK